MEKIANNQHIQLSKGRGLESKYHSLLGIIGIIFVAVALRPSLVSIGPVLPAITGSFSLSHSTAGLLTTIPDVLMGILALPTPWLAHRFGRDRLIIAAMILLTISTFARAFAPNVVVLMLTTAGVGAGIAVTGALLSGFIKATFAARAALVMGIYSTALALGSTVSAFLTVPISEHTGSWRFSIGSYAFVAFLGTGAWILLSRYSGKNPVGPAALVTGHVKLPWRNPSAWKVALFFACINFLFYALLAWIVAMFIESGLSEKEAGSLLACFTSAFMIGTPLISSLSRSTDRRIWLASCSILTLVGLVMILSVPNWYPAVSVFITALGLAGAFTLGMTLPLDNTHNVAQTNSWTAFMLTIGYLLAGLGPFSVGLLRDFTGGFSVPVYLLAIVAGIMLVLSFWLKPQAGEPHLVYRRG